LRFTIELLETSNHKKGKDVVVGERKTGRKETPSQTRRRLCKERTDDTLLGYSGRTAFRRE
jgi:hypothetical protein